MLAMTGKEVTTYVRDSMQSLSLSHGSINHDASRQTRNPYPIFYWTQVSLGSDLWVRLSFTDWVQHLVQTKLMWLWLMKIQTQYLLITPIGHCKAIWQCEWYNLVMNFGTKQCKWCHLMTKCWMNASGATWWPNFQLMQVASPFGQNCNWCK